MSRSNTILAVMLTLMLVAASRADGQVEFEVYQSFTAPRAAAWEFFTIDGQSFLALANHFNGNSDYDRDSTIYQWDGVDFVQVQTIPTHGANDWEYFSIDGDHFLAVANHRSGNNYEIESVIYRWNGSAFVIFQSLATLGALDWEFLTVGSEKYLAVANLRSNANFEVDSAIYRWTGADFQLELTRPTRAAFDWEAFEHGGQSFLAVANSAGGSSMIYRWESGNLADYLTIPTASSNDLEFFTIDGRDYLATANFVLSPSSIFELGDGVVLETHPLATSKAHDLDHFRIGSMDFLIAANNDGDSVLYRIEGRTYHEHQAIPTAGPVEWEYFEIGSDSFLAVANLGGSSHVLRAEGALGPNCCNVILPLISEGDFSVVGQDVLFPPTSIAGVDVYARVNDATWTATDTTGLGAGWHVTLTATDHLRGDADPANRVIPVGESEDFTVECLDSEIVVVSGAGVPPTCPNGAQPIPLQGENPLTILRAGVGEGMGIFDFLPQFEILVPGSVIIDIYRSQLLIDIVAGP